MTARNCGAALFAAGELKRAALQKFVGKPDKMGGVARAALDLLVGQAHVAGAGRT